MRQAPSTIPSTLKPPSTPKQQRLSTIIKQKYPGEYDDYDDDELEKMIVAKYPGEYDDYVQPSTIETKVEAPKIEEPGFLSRTGTFAKGVGEYGLDLFKATHGDFSAMNKLSEGMIAPFKEAYSQEEQDKYGNDFGGRLKRGARLGSKLLGFDPNAIEEDWAKSNYGALAGDIIPPVGLGVLLHKVGKMGGVPKEALPREPTVNVVPPVERLNAAPEGPRPRGLLNAPPPTRLPGVPPRFVGPSGDGPRLADVYNPATADIFGQQVPDVNRATGRVQTPGLFPESTEPRPRTINPFKETLPPIDTLPLVDDSFSKLYNQPITPPNMGMVATEPRPVMQRSPIVSKFKPDIGVVGEGEPRPVGAGSTIPRKPGLLGRLFRDESGTFDPEGMGKELERLKQQFLEKQSKKRGFAEPKEPINLEEPLKGGELATIPKTPEVKTPYLSKLGLEYLRVTDPQQYQHAINTGQEPLPPAGMKVRDVIAAITKYGGTVPKLDREPIDVPEQYGDKGTTDFSQSPYGPEHYPGEHPDDTRNIAQVISFKNTGLKLSDPNHPLNLPDVEPIKNPEEIVKWRDKITEQVSRGRELSPEDTVRMIKETGLSESDVEDLHQSIAHELSDVDTSVLPDEKDKPQSMQVRPGGYGSPTSKPTINPRTGRPNLAMGGADPQVIRQLGTSLYTKDRPSVLIQELMQNTLDEMKIAKVQKPVRIGFTQNTTNPATQQSGKSIIFQDFGRGMNESQLYNEFSDVGKSGKRHIQGAAGGFGFAKAAPFLGGDFMRTESITVENGKKVKYTFWGKPEEFLNQEVGVPLHSEVVSDSTPTGMRVEVFFPNDKYFGQAQELLQTITESSPGVKDIESYENYREPDTALPTSKVNKFTREGEAGLPATERSKVKKFAGKPLPTFKDVVNDAANDADVYYDLDNKERRTMKLVFLNNGVYYYSEGQGVGMHALPHIPERVVIDIKSKVAEGHDKYPFPANRQGLNEEVKEKYREWISDKIIKPARNVYENELQHLYDTTQPDPGMNHVVIDSEEKYTPAELDRVKRSPTLKKVADIMGTLLRDLQDHFAPDELVGTTEKYGFRIADPGQGGMNISNPSTNSPTLETLVVSNIFDGFYSGFTSRSTYDYLPKTLEPPEASRRIVHVIKHEFAHNLARSEGGSFTWAFSQVDTRFPRTTHYESQIFKAITDRAGDYVTEIPELLQEYIEARKRRGTKEDVLARQAASIEDTGNRKSKGVSGGNKPDGERTPLKKEEIEAAMDEAAGAELPQVESIGDYTTKTQPEWWGKEPKTVKIGKGRSKFLPTKRSLLDYEQESLPAKVEPLTEKVLEKHRQQEEVRGTLPTAIPKGKLSERFKLGEGPVADTGKWSGGGGKPPKPPTKLDFEPPEPPDEPKKPKYIPPEKADVVYQDREFLKGKGKNRIEKEADVQKQKAKRDSKKTVEQIIEDKKKQNPILQTPTFTGAVKGILPRLRKNAFYKSTYERVGVSGLTKLERLGDAGKKLAKLLRDERTESARLGGEHAAITRRVRRSLSKAEQAEVIKILDGQMPLSKASIPNVRLAYRNLRESLDKLGNEAISSDIRMRSSKGENVPFEKHKGEYFPHRYPKELFNDPVALREKLLKAGNSPATVDAMMKNVTEKGERFSSAQHARDFELPGYLEDLDVLEAHQYEMGKNITRAKRFGPMNVADKTSPISKLIAETSDPAKAADIVNTYLDRRERGVYHDASKKVYDAAVKATVASKLSLFGISNMGDLASMSGSMGMKNVIKSIAKVIADPHGSADIAAESGGHAILKRELLHDVGEGNLLGKAYGTTTSEKLMRTIGALTGRTTVQNLFKLAKKNPKYIKTLEAFVDGDVHEVLKQKELTKEQIDFGGGRGIELSSGVPDPLSTPEIANARNPINKLPFLLKRFAFMNTKNMIEAVKRQPTFSKKLVRAAAIVGTYQLAGEAIGDVKALIKGLASGNIKEDVKNRGQFIGSGSDTLDRVMANFLQSALFGIVGDVSESIAQKKLGKISGSIGGPVASDADEIANVVGDLMSPSKKAEFGKPSPKSKYDSLGKFLLRRVPYIGAGLDERWSKEKQTGLKGLPDIR